MATMKAKAYIYGSKEKKRIVGAKKTKDIIINRLTYSEQSEDLRMWIQGTKTIGGSSGYECLY